MFRREEIAKDKGFFSSEIENSLSPSLYLDFPALQSAIAASRRSASKLAARAEKERISR